MKEYIKEKLRKGIIQTPFKIKESYFPNNNQLLESIKTEIADKGINRNYIISKFKAGLEKKDNDGFAKGIIATLMWGAYIEVLRQQGKSTYENLLAQDLNTFGKNIHKLLIGEDGTKNAYDSLLNGENKIKYIGEAYFTKFLFFIAKAHNEIHAKNKIAPLPLIYDKWANNFYYALLLEYKPLQLDRMGIVISEYSFKDDVLNKVQIIPKKREHFEYYMNYIDDIAEWSKNFEVESDKLEEILFGEEIKKGNKNHNPRFYVMNFVFDKKFKKTIYKP